MRTTPKSSKGLLEIRKYSNRRYYDSTNSRHLTLEEIRDLIRQGYDIHVTDNQTSANITPKVLTQIILDLDAPKLDLFPEPLLAQLIRVNDQLVKGFYEKFFGQALHAFLDYQRLVETQLAQGAALPNLFPPIAAWAQALMNPLASHPSFHEPGPSELPDAEDALAAKLAELQQQLDQLKSLQVTKPTPTPKPAPRSRKSRSKRG
jgi:polyhydroxyalkanoate synthesis repressor PhaR